MNLKISHALTGIVGVAAAGFLVCQLGACGGGGGGSSSSSDGVSDSGPEGLSGSYRQINLGIDDESVWTNLIAHQVDEANGELDAELLRVSDGAPEPGTTFTLEYSEDSNNVLTVTGAIPDAEGQISGDGTTFNLSDAEGGVMFGLQLGSGRTDALLDGDYFVATAYSADNDGPNFYTGHYDTSFDGSGAVTGQTWYSTPAPGNGFEGSGTYSVADNGTVNIADSDEAQDILGAVRYDGEVFLGSHDLWDGSETWDTGSADNTQKGVFVGVQKSSNATDALLEGTYDMRYACSTNNNTGTSPDGWADGEATLTLDANGDGNWTEGGTDTALSIDLANDGTFEISDWNNDGAVSPSGDVMVMVNTSKFDDSYCLSLGVKQP